MGNMTLGLTLMLIGMITVFAILLIVIYLSKLLIILINRYAPAPAPAAAAGSKDAVSATVRRVVEATVERLTGGKGTVARIEKV